MKRILIVDDLATVRQQVGIALSQAGFDVVEAANGAEGADIIENYSSSCYGDLRCKYADYELHRNAEEGQG